MSTLPLSLEGASFFVPSGWSRKTLFPAHLTQGPGRPPYTATRWRAGRGCAEGGGKRTSSRKTARLAWTQNTSPVLFRNGREKKLLALEPDCVLVPVIPLFLRNVPLCCFLASCIPNNRAFCGMKSFGFVVASVQLVALKRGCCQHRMPRFANVFTFVFSLSFSVYICSE